MDCFSEGAEADSDSDCSYQAAVWVNASTIINLLIIVHKIQTVKTQGRDFQLLQFPMLNIKSSTKSPQTTVVAKASGIDQF